jgi:hypothetical protein
VVLDPPIKNNLRLVAEKEHTSLSHLLNLAAEAYLQKYVEQEQERLKKITVTTNESMR